MAALSFSQLDLNAIDTVHTVDEQDQYEDERNLSSCKPVEAKMVQVEGYLHAILQLRYDRILGDEGEELALDGVW